MLAPGTEAPLSVSTHQLVHKFPHPGATPLWAGLDGGEEAAGHPGTCHSPRLSLPLPGLRTLSGMSHCSR